MHLSFLDSLHQALCAKFPQANLTMETLDSAVDLCPAQFTGDVTLSCFILAKTLRGNPMQLAADIKTILDANPAIKGTEVVKAFVNITLDTETLLKDTVAEEGAILKNAVLPEEERQRILIEFSAPNTNKPQHLGHVRNNTVGMSTASILKRAGHQVTQVNLVNDRGIHICKSMLAYQRFGNQTTPESCGKKGDHLVGDFYVAFDKAFRAEVAELKLNHPEWKDTEAADLFLETEIGKCAQEMLQKWEAGDEEVRSLWKTMNQWVFDGFAQTYKRMGITFDKTYLESQTYMLGKDIIADGLKRGVFSKREDGATIISFDDKSLGTKVVLRSDGTSVYVTQDIGTTLLKQRDFNPDRQIWVVGDEQIRHFKVLFAILSALGYSWAKNLTHMAYGMVNLPSGRMKSREGTVVDADDLFDEMKELARAATLEKAGDNPPADLEERAEAIGMAALKFMLLKVNPKTTILFDPNASIKFEGDTGPYVLYACARISSILRKANLSADALNGSKINWELLAAKEEHALALRCMKYGDAIRKSARELDSSVLTGYLLDLAKDFSAFYNHCPVLAAEDANLRLARLALAARVKEILADGLRTLTIRPLESM